MPLAWNNFSPTCKSSSPSRCDAAAARANQPPSTRAKLALSMRILIAEPLDFSPPALARLAAVGQVELRACTGEELWQAFRDYDAIWLRLAHRVTGERLPPDLRCRFLAVPTTGLDHLDLDACRQRGVQVLSLRGEVDFLRNIRATAELTLALALALVRHVVPAARSVLAGEWNRDAFRGRELFGKTVGLVGVGRLGTLVAGYFRAFGAEVLGFDPRPDFPHDVAERVDSLDNLCARSQLVSIHAVLDDTTRQLVGRRQFAAMPRGAFLVNTSRGGIVDDGALVDALDRGHLAGAALDVLDGEPGITADHPLVRYAQTHPNLLIVPHIGGNTYESFAATELFLAQQLAERLEQLSVERGAIASQ